jgi:hypothetical protein
MKNPAPKLAVILSDLHAGSTYGIMPAGFHIKEGNEIGLNTTQKWLLECWEDCWEWFYSLCGADPFSIIINGDAVDGVHHGTTEVWSNDESDHGIAAYHLLKNHCIKASSVFLTEGTNIHTKGHEHTLAYQLKSAGGKIKMPKGHGGAWPSLEVEFAKTLCKFDHHISTTSRPYLEGSGLSIAMGAERVESGRSGHPIPRVFGRAHRHIFGEFCDGYGLIFTTPPWQTSTRYGRKFAPHSKIQVGMVVLDWRDTKEEDCVPVLHKKLFCTERQRPATHD